MEVRMEIHRSLGVSRLVAFMAAHRGRSAHDRLLARLDRSVAEARELCERAEDLYPDGTIAGAFQTVLARQTRDWMHRADAVARSVRPGGDTICGARAQELRILIDNANVAIMRPAESHEAWTGFYRLVRQAQFSVAPPDAG
jgi:hypothetical protein